MRRGICEIAGFRHARACHRCITMARGESNDTPAYENRLERKTKKDNERNRLDALISLSFDRCALQNVTENKKSEAFFALR